MNMHNGIQFSSPLAAGTGCDHQSATVGLVTVMFGTHWFVVPFGFAFFSRGKPRGQGGPAQL
jgi:hypothetical protein